MSNLKVGDRVRINGSVPSTWWLKPGDVGTLRPTETTWDFRIELDRRSKQGYNIGYVNAEHVDLIAPAAEYIICLKKDGVFLPSEEPRVYSSERQAYHVARDMAKKYGGRFVVFKAEGEAFLPAVDPEVTSY